MSDLELVNFYNGVSFFSTKSFQARNDLYLEIQARKDLSQEEKIYLIDLADGYQFLHTVETWDTSVRLKRLPNGRIGKILVNNPTLMRCAKMPLQIVSRGSDAFYENFKFITCDVDALNTARSLERFYN